MSAGPAWTSVLRAPLGIQAARVFTVEIITLNASVHMRPGDRGQRAHRRYLRCRQVWLPLALPGLRRSVLSRHRQPGDAELAGGLRYRPGLPVPGLAAAQGLFTSALGAQLT